MLLSHWPCHILYFSSYHALFFFLSKLSFWGQIFNHQTLLSTICKAYTLENRFLGNSENTTVYDSRCEKGGVPYRFLIVHGCLKERQKLSHGKVHFNKEAMFKKNIGSEAQWQMSFAMTVAKDEQLLTSATSLYSASKDIPFSTDLSYHLWGKDRPKDKNISLSSDAQHGHSPASASPHSPGSKNTCMFHDFH